MNSSEKDVSDMLKKTFTPILLAIGIVGNLVSMLIFSNESLKKYTTFRLLFLLSLIDICVLLTGCGDILLQVPITVNLLQIRIESSLESKKKTNRLLRLGHLDFQFIFSDYFILLTLYFFMKSFKLMFYS